LQRSLRRFLRRRGSSDLEIDNAAHHHFLTLLILDREVFPGERKYTMRELAQRADTDLDTARTAWRAIGFPDLPDDLRAFTDADVRALQAFSRRVETGSLFGGWTLERGLAQARVLSSGMARVADAETDDLAHAVGLAREAGLDDEATAAVLAERLNFAEISRLVDHVHRIHLRAAIWRRLAGVEPSSPGALIGAVGFVDMVGYTALTQELDADELGALVARFSDLAHDTVAAAGGRIVKTIGDEVMFVTDTAPSAATISLELGERAHDDELLPDTSA
jgi:adenylate cyclase